jgi:hypothetical protein
MFREYQAHLHNFRAAASGPIHFDQSRDLDKRAPPSRKVDTKLGGIQADIMVNARRVTE